MDFCAWGRRAYDLAVILNELHEATPNRSESRVSNSSAARLQKQQYDHLPTFQVLQLLRALRLHTANADEMEALVKNSFRRFS